MQAEAGNWLNGLTPMFAAAEAVTKAATKAGETAAAGPEFGLFDALLIIAIGLGIWLVYTWPEIPWGTLQWVAIAMMIIAPVFTYPFTKSTWLAVDLVFQPPTAKDRQAV